MKNVRLLFGLLLGAAVMTTACDGGGYTEVDPISGCIDPAATNYNPDAEEDDGSCMYGDGTGGAGGTGGTGGGVDLTQIPSIEILEINLTSFDFGGQGESGELEFFTEVYNHGSGQWMFVGVNNTNSCMEVAASGDLPVDLLCPNSLVIDNDHFNSQIQLEVADADVNTDDDYFGTVSFTPADYIDASTGSKTITLSNTSGIGYTLEIFISW